MAGYRRPNIRCDAADFDGTNDFMTRGAGLTGASDSKTGILSVWARFDAGTSSQELFTAQGSVGGADARFQVFRQSGPGPLTITGVNAAGTQILLIPTSSNFSAGASWIHFLASWDLAAGVTNSYINDASNKGSVTATNDSIDYTNGDWTIGAVASGSGKFNGCLAEFFFAPGQYLDFSLVSNRRKFISAGGKPVHLGTTGALPTGTAPLVYQHIDDAEAVANFATNRGTGGNFTITGTLDTASDSPSD